MQEMEFNLLDEPWIRVRRDDCVVEEVSLTDALLNAHLYQDLAGETPTQDAAVLRLLLAVLHTIFSRVDENGQSAPLTSVDSALIRWGQLWPKGYLEGKPIRDYLSQWHERFWLFHPDRPFWQVPEACIGTEYGAAKLNGELSESSNKLRLFSNCAGDEKDTLSYSAAARWLLYINGYDDTSAKPKGKNLPSPGAGWLGKIGLIQANGHTLFETLLLNLILLRDGIELWGANHPCWELDVPRSAERTEIAVPDNPAALLTLQSRRLLLKRINGRVSGYTLLGGDFFSAEAAFAEQMTVWRGIQPKKDTPIVYKPRRHDPTRFFWQEFPTIFDSDMTESNVRMPGIVRWIARLQQSELLGKDEMCCFSISGAVYGDKDFFVKDAYSDQISFHAQLLEDLGRSWRRSIADEIKNCEKLARAMENLARDLAIADGAGAIRDATGVVKARFYYCIDMPFREWLQSIDPRWDIDAAIESRLSWRNSAQDIAKSLALDLLGQVGDTALIGRKVKVDDELEVFYSAPTAYERFVRCVHVIYKDQI